MRRATIISIITILLCMSQWVLCAVPEAPSGLQFTVSGNRVDLSWFDNSNNEIGFVVERQIDSGGFEILNDSLYVNATSYADEALSYGYTYTYRLYAYNLEGASEYSGIASVNLLYESTTIRVDMATAIDDAFLDSIEPDLNYGATAVAEHFDLPYLVRFNLPAILDGKRILSANLHVYGADHMGQWSENLFMDVYRVSRSWDPGQVTWNEALTGEAWTQAGGDVDRVVGAVLIAAYNEETGQVESPIFGETAETYYPPADVTDVVRRWVRGEVDNFGLLLVNQTEFSHKLAASESVNHTYLEITYSHSCSCDNPADFNYDCRVNLVDFAVLAANWEQESDETDLAPVGGDGYVGLADLIVFAEQWLVECSGQGEGGGEGGEIVGE